MLPKSIANFLEKNNVKYEILEHKTVFTAFDKAVTLAASIGKITPAMIGKTVIISLDGKDHAIGLIPANKNLDKKKLLETINRYLQKIKKGHSDERDSHNFWLHQASRYSRAEFATEKWMKEKIKGVKPGAAPPFGVLYKLPFFIDNALAKTPKIIVNGGKYELSIKLSPASLIKLDPNTVKGGFSVAKK